MQGRLRAAFIFLVLAFASFGASRWLALPSAGPFAFTFLAIAAVQFAAAAVSNFLIERAHLPRFAVEMLVVACYVSILFHLLSREGVPIASMFYSSAVAIAVLGFALQDMLNNIAGGVALELEDDIHPGDYIRSAEYSGWVQHVRLRHTAIRTNNGDTVILPNSQLTRLPVQVLSREHRTFVPFHLPYAPNPQRVIDAVEAALRSSPIRGVRALPAPRCVLQQLAPGHIQYAAMVWTELPGADTELVSAVLMRLQFALRRAGLTVSEISQLVDMRRYREPSITATRPVDVLRRTPILRLLADPDLEALATHLQPLSFAPGEHIIRQGDRDYSMFFITSGEVRIALAGPDGAERHVSAMSEGDFFGEGSLLTGEARSASVIARTQVDCFRLAKEDLETLMSQREELAEDMSVVMTLRQSELSAAREELDMDAARRREAENQTQILARIRDFFGISSVEP